MDTATLAKRSFPSRRVLLTALLALCCLPLVACRGGGGSDDLAGSDLASSSVADSSAAMPMDLSAQGDGGPGVQDGGVDGSVSLDMDLPGVLLGVHLSEGTNSESEVVALETAIGRTLGIDSDYEDWTPTSQPVGFPDTDRIAWDKAAGRLLMISWRTDLDGASPGDAGCATEGNIASGVYDVQLKKQAQTLMSTGLPILVRWHYEMTDNDDDTCANDDMAVKADYPGSGARFVAAWQHIVTLFRDVGATNVQWVWAPSAGLFTDKTGNVDPVTWTYFYPGNDYVDWIANDNYNKTDTPMSYAADVDIANWYAQTAPLGKPLMQSETGANNDPAQSPDPETEWLTTARAALKTTYPAIRAFVYWGTDGSAYYANNPNYGGTGYELVGPGLAAFTAMASDPYFGGKE